MLSHYAHPRVRVEIDLRKALSLYHSDTEMVLS